ncbi:TPA: hypothetical protein ACIPUI_000305 [Citrobacter freundii]
MALRITADILRQKITRLEGAAPDEENAFYLALMRAALADIERDGQPASQLAPVRLPFCSASPVCEIEAGYAAGVSDCREAIRRAGYPIEGDD